MRRNFQGFRHFAVAKDDDVMFRFLDDAAMVHHFRGDLIVRGKALLQRLEAHLDPMLLENIGEAALGQTTMQRHLTAFEAGFRRVTGAGLLPLFTATGGLAQTRTWSPTETLLLMRRTFCRMKIIKTECHCLIR